MSVYLGNQKVGVTQEVNVDLPEGDEILRKSTKDALNDAVSYRVGDFVERTVPQMITELRKKYFQNREYDIMPDYDYEPWVRPQAWPDLDSLNLQMEGNDFIYMTYDNTSDFVAVALHVEKVTNGANIAVDVGHIENGSYVVDSSITGSSNNYVKWLTDADGDYPVVRVTGDIKYCYSYSVTKDGATQQYRRQPIVERIAYVPHLVGCCTSYSTNAWTTFTLQREVFNNGDGNALTSLYYAWAYGRDLRVLDITGLKTQKVTSLASSFRQLLKLNYLDLRHLNVEKVTSMDGTFEGSRALRELDLRGWQTNALTTLSSSFANCISLREIKGLKDFNTSNVTSLGSTFSGCRSIIELDLTKWNTEKVTTLTSCFNSCHNLIELDLSSWNVSKVTNMSSTFVYCYCLKRLNLTGWQTGILTTIYSIFSYCNSLSQINAQVLQVTSACKDMCYAFNHCWSVKELDVTGWDVSGLNSSNNCGHSIFNSCYSLERIIGIENFRFQHANSMAAMFQNCYSLRSLDLSNWTVTNATNLSNIFSGCFCLKELDLSKWTPNNCTNFAGMFSSCHSLITVGDISNWNTSNVTSMGSMFRYCYSLREMPNISNWDFSKVTTIEYIFSECLSLKTVTWRNISLPVCTSIISLFRYDYNLEYADLSGWSIPSVTNNTSYYQTLGDCWCLRTVVGFPIPSTYTNIGFQNCENLSYESLLAILNALPQTTSGHTVRIPAMSVNSLTAAEKAIATNKNWTIANS